MTDDLAIQKTRAVKEILGISLKYLSTNARDLVLGIGLFSMPFIFAGNLISFLVTDDRRSLGKVLFYKKALDKNYFVLFIIAYLIYLVGLCLFNLTINKRLTLAKSAEADQQDFAMKLKKDLGEDLKNFAMSFVIVYVIYLLLSEGLNYFSAVTYNETNSFASDIVSYFGSQIGSFILFSPFIVIMALGFFMGFSTLFICFRDNLGVTESIKKNWQYVSAKPVKIILTSVLLLGICFFGYNIMLFIIQRFEFWMYMSEINPVFLFITGFFQTIVVCMVALYYNISSIYLLGSIEDELEGLYIKSKIENI